MSKLVYPSTEHNFFTDEELEEVEEMLWRGYVPPRFVRHDLDTFPNQSWHLHLSPKEIEAARAELAKQNAERAAYWVAQREAIREEHLAAQREYRESFGKKRMVSQYSAFRCDNCHRTFYSVRDNADAEQEYLDTFGAAATENRLAVCEGCYDRLLNESSSNQEQGSGT